MKEKSKKNSGKVFLNVPIERQTFNYDCGAKALQAIINYYGLDVREDHIFKGAGTTKEGTPVKGIVKFAKKLGFKCVSESKMDIDKIKSYLDKKIPVLVVLQAWADNKVNWKKDWSDGHYVVAVGYDKDKFYFEDPASIKLTYLHYHEFEERWHDVGADKKKYIHHGIAIWGKKIKTRELVHMD